MRRGHPYIPGETSLRHLPPGAGPRVLRDGAVARARLHRPSATPASVAVEPLLPCGACFACNAVTRTAVPSSRLWARTLAGHWQRRLSCLPPVATRWGTFLLQARRPGGAALDRAAGRRAGWGAGPATRCWCSVQGPRFGQAVTICAADRGAEVMVVDKLANRLELATHLGAGRRRRRVARIGRRGGQKLDFR